ncbi:endonuclease/exonuclease/phosphatase family protein [Piscirickettsia salmonis]|uniref:endonuclease/exonuclease/phosphatase family protein n=1 Tax=Piscirickettsia salmonis TaxID=1238 RepID=UPI003EBB605F
MPGKYNIQSLTFNMGNKKIDDKHIKKICDELRGDSPDPAVIHVSAQEAKDDDGTLAQQMLKHFPGYELVHNAKFEVQTKVMEGKSTTQLGLLVRKDLLQSGVVSKGRLASAGKVHGVDLWGARRNKGGLHATLEIDGKAVAFGSGHFDSYSDEHREREAHALLSRCGPAAMTLVAADFNHRFKPEAMTKYDAKRERCVLKSDEQVDNIAAYDPLSRGDVKYLTDDYGMEFHTLKHYTHHEEKKDNKVRYKDKRGTGDVGVLDNIGLIGDKDTCEMVTARAVLLDDDAEHIQGSDHRPVIATVKFDSASTSYLQHNRDLLIGRLDGHFGCSLQGATEPVIHAMSAAYNYLWHRKYGNGSWRNRFMSDKGSCAIDKLAEWLKGHPKAEQEEVEQQVFQALFEQGEYKSKWFEFAAETTHKKHSRLAYFINEGFFSKALTVSSSAPQQAPEPIFQQSFESLATEQRQEIRQRVMRTAAVRAC